MIPADYDLPNAFKIWASGGSEVGIDFPHNLKGLEIVVGNRGHKNPARFLGDNFQFRTLITGVTTVRNAENDLTEVWLEVLQRYVGYAPIAGIRFSFQTMTFSLFTEVLNRNNEFSVSVRTPPL